MSMVAVIRKRLVEEHRVMSEETFSEGLALASILPGPVAVNLAAYCGFFLSGLRGAFIAVTAVLLPSFSLMVILFHLIRFSGSDNYFSRAIFFVSGIAFAIILSAGLAGLKKYCNSVTTAFVAIFTMAIVFLVPGYLTIIILLCGFALLGQFMPATITDQSFIGSPLFSGSSVRLLAPAAAFILVAALGTLFLPALIFREFALIGLTLFGGGYVVVPFLNATLVESLHWINQSDLLTGISLGQLTPGPILISAAFFGQKIAGLSGAVAATAGMFLPSALVMIYCTYYLQYIRSSHFYLRALTYIFPSVSGLIIISGVQILLNSWKQYDEPWHFIWWGVAFAGIYFLKINTILMIGLAIALGLLTLAF